MASVYRVNGKDKKRAFYEVAYLDTQGNRQRIRVGAVGYDGARSDARRIESLIAYRANNEEPNNTTKEWLSTLANERPRIYKKLVRRGLASKQKTYHANTDIDVHIINYEDYLRGCELKSSHIRQQINALRWIVKQINAKVMAGLHNESVANAVRIKRSAGAAARTCNLYLGAARSFATWAVKTDRLDTNPLASFKRYKVSKDRRKVRRPLQPEELSRIVSAAEASRVVRYGLNGGERAILYRVAAGTGFRANELRTLPRLARTSIVSRLQ